MEFAGVGISMLRGSTDPTLEKDPPDDESFQVSHETIYLSLYIQARGALEKELIKHLRHTQKTSNHGRITDTVSISERPPEVEDRAVPGHWEGDRRTH